MKAIRSLLLAASFGVGALLATSSARADGPAKPPAKNAEISIQITARPMRPSAVVDLGRLLPDIELSKIEQKFYQQIRNILLSEPF